MIGTTFCDPQLGHNRLLPFFGVVCSFIMLALFVYFRRDLIPSRIIVVFQDLTPLSIELKTKTIDLNIPLENSSRQPDLYGLIFGS